MSHPDGTIELSPRATGPDPLARAPGEVRVLVDPVRGGRVAQITVGRQRLLCDDPAAGAIGWGSYPMAPWAGRLRDGRFTHDGTAYRLEPNHQDVDGSRHAIHGTVFASPWTVDERGPDSVTLHCALGASLGWPLGGTARQTIALDGDSVLCRLTVESTEGPFPASIGWHPWFVKPERLVFEPSAMFGRADVGLPRPDVVPPEPGPWDDTFLNDRPVQLIHPTGSDVGAVIVTSDCTHWVVYDQPAHATCVEPQSGPPDALNVAPLLVTASDPLTRWMRIAWTT